jgi:hypothetical protein
VALLEELVDAAHDLEPGVFVAVGLVEVVSGRSEFAVVDVEVVLPVRGAHGVWGCRGAAHRTRALTHHGGLWWCDSRG